MRDLKLIHLSCGIVLAVAVAGALCAQTTSTPPATPVLQTLNIERALDPTEILTTLTPNIPLNVVLGIKAATLELRESMNYNPVNQVLTINAFTVQAKSPIPTPPGPTLTSSILSIASVNVDKVYNALTPRPSVMLTGTISGNSPLSPYGNLAGAPAALSIGYTTDSPPKMANVVLSIAGSAVEFSADAQGTLAFVQPTVTPPPGANPTIVISSPTSVYTKIADLDASGSTSPNMPLTFSWTVINGNADIARANTSKALAYLNGGFGSYTFQLTVTDSKGLVTTQMVTINLY